ncbi:SRPBCC family protein [Myxosarcina sp. GI1]|uniref:SRPBCC family protein n=1 Tax=Myxosarcina sp. GI1 TaxID=1541065 RepID=UPI000567B475|nr:SRPBCC family protein [Myxosarcina sp. GI1]
MLHFEYSSAIDAPIEAVWQFHERQDILDILTPPWQPVTVVRHEGGLNVGAISEFRLNLGFVPIKWVAKHTECQPNCLFTDIQIEGPMQSWQHRHQFTSEGDKTILTDAIAYEIPGGWLAELLLGWWVDSRLKEMFRYRHEVTKKECEIVSS